MKCPLCSAQLVRLPNNPKRFRCDSCKCVFNAGQLDRLYGVKSGDKLHFAVLPFETEHMHEKHMSEGGVGSGVGRQGNSGFVDYALPVVNQQVLQGVDDFGVPASSVITRDLEQQGVGVGHGGLSDASRQFVMKLIIGIVVFLFVVSSLGSVLIGILTAISDDFGDGFAFNEEIASIVSDGDEELMKEYVVGDEFRLDDYDVGVDVGSFVDRGRDFVVVHMSWVNNGVERESGGTALWMSLFDKDGNFVLEDYMVDDVEGVYGDNNKYEMVDVGKKSEFDVAYQVVSDDYPLYLQVRASDDVLRYFDVPSEYFKIERVDGRFVVTEVAGVDW